MISCKQATDFISKKEEGKLSVKQILQLWLHLGVCSFCKLFYKQSKIIASQATHLHDHLDIKLSQPEKDAIIKKIEEE